MVLAKALGASPAILRPSTEQAAPQCPAAPCLLLAAGSFGSDALPILFSVPHCGEDHLPLCRARNEPPQTILAPSLTALVQWDISKLLGSVPSMRRG